MDSSRNGKFLFFHEYIALWASLIKIKLKIGNNSSSLWPRGANIFDDKFMGSRSFIWDLKIRIWLHCDFGPKSKENINYLAIYKDLQEILWSKVLLPYFEHFLSKNFLSSRKFSNYWHVYYIRSPWLHWWEVSIWD